jgi:hypothetical protein
MRKSEVSLRSYSLDPVRVTTGGSIVWGEWDSEAARGMWWGCIMAGGVPEVCQRLCWGR